MKGVLPWWVRWACRAGTRDFYSASAALVGTVQNIFFLTVHYLNAFVPTTLKLHGQAAVLARLSLILPSLNCVSTCMICGVPFISQVSHSQCIKTNKNTNLKQRSAILSRLRRRR
jgi:hypothetical protein